MSKGIYKYNERIGSLRHCETRDIEVYGAGGEYLGRVQIEADSEEKAETIRALLRRWV